MKNDSLVVIGRLSYPSPSAASNRVHLYCKALKGVKGSPLVINLHSTFPQKKVISYLGRNDGIPFYFAQKSPYRKKNIVVRNYKKIIGLINTVIVVRKVNRRNHTKVLFYNCEYADEVFVGICLRLSGIKIIRDFSEAPSYIIKNKKNPFIESFLHRCRLKIYHDIIVISEYLNKFYSAKFPAGHIYQIPILVDIERFTARKDTPRSQKPLLTYVGFMGGNKDGLQDLIEAMKVVKDAVPDFTLNLIGTASARELTQLKNKVSELGLQDHIVFVGSKSPSEIPGYLLQSDLLVLARPNNNQAKAGFPTKLGEYLASKKPVVITKTGEIPKYLEDGKTAYLAEPDDVNNFAQKVIAALNDVHSKTVGENGFEVAARNFNYKLYGEKILEIIKN